MIRAVPCPREGRFAIVTSVGRGMRWTWAARATSAAEADGEVVWSWRPWAGVKFANDDLQMTVTKKSWTPRRARSSVNTIAQGVPDRSSEPVVTYSCATLHRTRGCGCVGHPAFPAPSLIEGRDPCKTRAHSRRGNVVRCFKCERT